MLAALNEDDAEDWIDVLGDSVPEDAELPNFDEEEEEVRSLAWPSKYIEFQVTLVLSLSIDPHDSRLFNQTRRKQEGADQIFSFNCWGLCLSPSSPCLFFFFLSFFFLVLETSLVHSQGQHHHLPQEEKCLCFPVFPRQFSRADSFLPMLTGP